MDKHILIIAGTIAFICAITALAASILLEQNIASLFMLLCDAILVFMCIHAIMSDHALWEPGE